MEVNVYCPRPRLTAGVCSYVATIRLTAADYGALHTDERGACARLAEGIEQLAHAPRHPFLVLGPGPVLLEYDDERRATAAARRLARAPGATATVIRLDSTPTVVLVATDDGVRPPAPC